MNSVYIGVDLAWGEKNLSGFCVLQESAKKLKIIDIKLLKSIDHIVDEIQKYKEYKVHVGIDAPLIVPNDSGNREIEKEFNKDFAKYRISMLPTNRKLLTKNSSKIRSEELFLKLQEHGFKRDYNSDKVVFEVYPHSTIAVCFNNNKILPYKRKKGRNTEFIKEQLHIYRRYLQKEIYAHSVFKYDISQMKGQDIKDYEDMLDSLTCAFSVFFCQNYDANFYQLDGVDTFVTPASSWRVYMLRCSDNSLYTGITTDLKRRVKEHNSSSKGAKYTRNKRPVELVYSEICDDKSSAAKRESEIKKLSRDRKLGLIC